MGNFGSISVGTSEFILGGGVFLLDSIGFLGSLVEPLPLPHVWQCFVSAVLMLFLLELVMGTVSSMNLWDYFMVGLGAGVGCFIGALLAGFSIYMMPLGGAIGAILAYKRGVLKSVIS